MFLGLKITKSGIWLCHSLQFAAMLTVLSNLFQYYVYLGQLKRMGGFLSRYGPALVVLAASLLLMVHPTVFLLKDLQLIHPICENGSALGAMYVCTHTGLVMLFCGAAWGTDGFEVLRVAWARRRGA